jgi:hypothetical protein
MGTPEDIVDVVAFLAGGKGRVVRMTGVFDGHRAVRRTKR